MDSTTLYVTVKYVYLYRGNMFQETTMPVLSRSENLNDTGEFAKDILIV